MKKSSHPDIALFAYLNGDADARGAQAIEAHLSTCEVCARVAAAVRALRQTVAERLGDGARESQISNLKSEIFYEHPDISELASFFYDNSRRANSRVAAHAALCRSCAEAVEQYAQGERAASEYDPARAVAGEVPAQAWEMICDWEESSYAKPKPASDVLGQELLTRLSRLIDEVAPQIREIPIKDPRSQPAERVPVMVVTGSGEVRSVEYFEKSVDSTGASVLRHAEGSERFNDRAIHMLMKSGPAEPLVISKRILRDNVRIQLTEEQEGQGWTVGYFIVES